MHLLEDGGKYLFHELVMAHLTDFLLGVGSDEVADPTLVVNNIVGLQALEGMTVFGFTSISTASSRTDGIRLSAL